MTAEEKEQAFCTFHACKYNTGLRCTRKEPTVADERPFDALMEEE